MDDGDSLSTRTQVRQFTEQPPTDDDRVLVLRGHGDRVRGRHDGVPTRFSSATTSLTTSFNGRSLVSTVTVATS